MGDPLPAGLSHRLAAGAARRGTRARPVPLARRPLGAAYSLWDLASAQIQAIGGVDPALEEEMAAGLAVAREARDARLASGFLHRDLRDDPEHGTSGRSARALVEGAKFTDRDDVARRAVMLNNTAEIEMQLGAYEKAVSLGREAVALTEEARPWIAAIVLVTVGLGRAKARQRRRRRASRCSRPYRPRAYDNEYWIAAVFDVLAQLALHTGELERSARLAGFAQASYERGPVRQIIQQRFFDECLAALRERLQPAAFDREWDYGFAMSIDESCGSPKRYAKCSHFRTSFSTWASAAAVARLAPEATVAIHVHATDKRDQVIVDRELSRGTRRRRAAGRRVRHSVGHLPAGTARAEIELQRVAVFLVHSGGQSQHHRDAGRRAGARHHADAARRYRAAIVPLRQADLRLLR